MNNTMLGCSAERARDRAQGVLAKQTRRMDPSPLADEPIGAARLRISQTSPTDNDISANEPNFRKRSQSGNRSENNA
jgi:hypothetical protein